MRFFSSFIITGFGSTNIDEGVRHRRLLSVKYINNGNEPSNISVICIALIYSVQWSFGMRRYNPGILAFLLALAGASPLLWSERFAAVSGSSFLGAF